MRHNRLAREDKYMYFASGWKNYEVLDADDEWEFKRKLPECGQVSYGGNAFYVRPMGFKHTGLFPEQAVNWDWMAARRTG